MDGRVMEDKCTDRWMDKLTDGWRDGEYMESGQTDGRMKGWNRLRCGYKTIKDGTNKMNLLSLQLCSHNKRSNLLENVS